MQLLTNTYILRRAPENISIRLPEELCIFFNKHLKHIFILFTRLLLLFYSVLRLLQHYFSYITEFPRYVTSSGVQLVNLP